jgi:hypothetical protein
MEVESIAGVLGWCDGLTVVEGGEVRCPIGEWRDGMFHRSVLVYSIGR